MKKTIIILIATVLIVTTVFIAVRSSSSTKNQQESSKINPQSDSPKIVSTKPDPLEDTVIGANDGIEISFNKPLQNIGEFKLKIEPKVDLKVELSSDRKTAKITPVKPLELGASYTIFIGTDTKFDGVGAWGQEKIFHFKTIKYTGV